MYRVRRRPLGEGDLTFGKRRRNFPFFRIFLYLLVLGGAVYVYIRADAIRPAIVARIGPTPLPTLSSPELIAQADAAYYEGELGDAIAIYEQIIALEPDNVVYLSEMARLQVLNGDYDAALETAERAIIADPESPNGYAVKALALDWTGNPEEAVVVAFQAIELDPNYARAHAYLAEAYVDLGRWTQGREQAELAIALDPFDVDARRDYAYLLEFIGDYEGAIAQYQQALTLNPNLLYLWYGLAINERGSGDYESAVSTFAEIISRTPEDPEPYVEIGKTYFEMREDDAAQDYLEQAMELVCQDCPLVSSEEILVDNYDESTRPVPDQLYLPAWERLGMVYFTRRNYESAIEVFTEAIAYWEQKPDLEIKPEAFYVTGLAYYYLDRCDRAVPYLMKTLEVVGDPENAPGAVNSSLSGLVLCRDFASHTVAFDWPEGYPEPRPEDLIIEPPSQNDATDGE